MTNIINPWNTGEAAVVDALEAEQQYVADTVAAAMKAKDIDSTSPEYDEVRDVAELAVRMVLSDAVSDEQDKTDGSGE